MSVKDGSRSNLTPSRRETGHSLLEYDGWGIAQGDRGGAGAYSLQRFSYARKNALTRQGRRSEVQSGRVSTANEQTM